MILEACAEFVAQFPIAESTLRIVGMAFLLYAIIIAIYAFSDNDF